MSAPNHPSPFLTRSLTSTSYSSTRTSTPSRAHQAHRRNDHFIPSITNYHNRSSSNNQLPTLASSQTNSANREWWDPETFHTPITGVKGLSEYVENDQFDDTHNNLDELSKDWTTTNDGFRIGLDVAREVIDHESTNTSNTSKEPRPLSLYITSPNLYTHLSAHPSFPVGIFVGITPLYPNVGHRLVGTRYIWSTSTGFEYTVEEEYCSVNLPLLSTLLEHEEIHRDDGFNLCVRVGPRSDIPQPFRVPDQVLSSTLEALGNLLDTRTGDVVLGCLQHAIIPLHDGDEIATPDQQVQSLSNPDDTASTLRSIVKSRKRTIFAHLEVLQAKSEYLKDLFNSGFKESENEKQQKRKIVVDDIEFKTLFWVIRLLSYSTTSSPLHSRFSKGKWEWYDLSSELEEYDDLEDRTAKSVSSESTSTCRSRRSEPMPITRTRNDTERTGSGIRNESASSNNPTTRPTVSSNRTRPIPTIDRSPELGKKARYSKFANMPRKPVDQPIITPSHQPDPDPHPHPTPVPPPANALEIYIAADKYRLDTLRGLAKEHLLESLDGEYCVPLAFATYPYDELHPEVLDYIVDHWITVKSSSEFLKCIQEVRQDVWGVDGPLVLHNIYMRL
uniref:BTB domain-containing protein n=1 Tax=Kwoniella bestiolae CBS 10118 TaxID=1296100 RepID=A0A1B9FZZ9_9TREE|nr:hypothetical protein I302_05806 [Kwoniella bestiolae CBS 10118]OCF24346.1 hypothetical protein I302_05806 [Kwoniella bestiolae CBS 10118]